MYFMDSLIQNHQNVNDNYNAILENVFCFSKTLRT